MVRSSIDRSNLLPLIVIDWHRKKLFGKVRLQKLVFLCEVKAKNERISDFYNFGCYKHGPYSSSLTSDINSHQVDGAINCETEIKNGKSLTKYFLTEKGKKQISEYISSHREDSINIKNILNKYGYWETGDLVEQIHKDFIDFVENPSPIKEKAEELSNLAAEYENKAFESIHDEDIIYSTILTMLGELFLKLSEKAKTNMANFSSATKNIYFQKWSRFLDRGNRTYTYLHMNEFKVPKDELLKIQNFVVSLTIEAEKYKFFPMNEELQSKIPVNSIKKIEKIIV